MSAHPRKIRAMSKGATTEQIIARRNACGCIIFVAWPGSHARFLREHHRDVRVQRVPAGTAQAVVCPHKVAPIQYVPPTVNT